ncbi:hypothetical protein Aperf_G00000041315 [Anoplocephala perfoliata]
MRFYCVNHACLVGIAFVSLLLYVVSSEEGTEEKAILSTQVDLKRFLRSYNYVDKYEHISRKLSHDVLAYVTPWNAKGYEKAKIFAKKFTIVSPVWFQLKPATYEVIGLHDIDAKWIESVKSINSQIKFAPRVIFERWDAGDYQQAFSNSGNRIDCIRALRDLCKKNNFEGLTVEVWMQHFGTSHQPGENAPIKWVAQCVRNLVPDDKDTGKRSKILTGVNFYGYDYIPAKRDGRAVVGHDVVDIARKYSPEFVWHDDAAEHSLEYTDGENVKHSLFFPSVYSLARRIAMVEELGVGLSIWEIGQGFDSFFEHI